MDHPVTTHWNFRIHFQSFRRDHSVWANILIHTFTTALAFFSGIGLVTALSPGLGACIGLAVFGAVAVCNAPLVSKGCALLYVLLSGGLGYWYAGQVPALLAFGLLLGSSLLQRWAHKLAHQPSTIWQLQRRHEKLAHILYLPVAVVQLLLERLHIVPELQ